MTWWNTRFKEDREGHNWENVAAKREDIPGVMAGLQRLHPISRNRSHRSKELLDSSNNIGRTVTLDINTPLNEPISVLSLESDDKQARAVTIQIMAAQQFGAFNNASESIEGLIGWGSGGVQAESRFDWLKGTMISVAASFVRVSVLSSTALPANSFLRVGAFGGYGVIESGERLHPQLTIPMGLAAPAGAVTVAIPPFAKDVHITRVLSAALGNPPSMRIHQLPTIFVGTANATEFYGAGVSMVRPMPIVPGASVIRAENTDIVNTIYRATFGLAI